MSNSNNSSELVNPNQTIDQQVLRLLQLMTKSPSKLKRMRACFKITKLADKRPKEVLRTCSLSQGPIFCLGLVFLVNKNDEDYRKARKESSSRTKNFTEYAHIKAERINQKLKREAIIELNQHRNKSKKELSWQESESETLDPKALLYDSEIDNDNLELKHIHTFKLNDLKACKNEKNKIESLIPDPKDFLIWLPINQIITLNDNNRDKSNLLTREIHKQKLSKEKCFRIQSVKLNKEKKKLQKLFPKKIRIHITSSTGRSSFPRRSLKPVHDRSASLTRAGSEIPQQRPDTKKSVLKYKDSSENIKIGQNNHRLVSRLRRRLGDERLDSNPRSFSLAVSKHSSFYQLRHNYQNCTRGGEIRVRGRDRQQSPDARSISALLNDNYNRNYGEDGDLRDHLESANLEKIAKKKFVFSCFFDKNGKKKKRFKRKPFEKKRINRSLNASQQTYTPKTVTKNSPSPYANFEGYLKSSYWLPGRNKTKKRKMTNVFDIFSLSNKKRTIVEVMERLEMRNQAAMMKIK